MKPKDNYKFIAHLGNLEGVDEIRQSKPEYVENAMCRGFDASIDVWYLPESNCLFSGALLPTFFVEKRFLESFHQNLWINCRDIPTLNYFIKNYKDTKLNYFLGFNGENSITSLTSQNYIWTKSGDPIWPHSIPFQSKSYEYALSALSELQGVSSNDIVTLKQKLSSQGGYF